MKILYCISVLTFGIATQTALACLPLSPEDAFIGRVGQISAIPLDNQKNGYAFEYQFSRHNFAWRPMMRRFDYSTPKQWQSQFDPKDINTNDLVVGLAYTPSGDNPKEYVINTLAPLTCENDTLIIGEPIVPNYGWNRDNQSCRHDDPTGVGVLNGFMNYDEGYYLQQLQDKYPTCTSLESAFPVVNDPTNATGKLSFWDKVKGWFGF